MRPCYKNKNGFTVHVFAPGIFVCNCGEKEGKLRTKYFGYLNQRNSVEQKVTDRRFGRIEDLVFCPVFPKRLIGSVKCRHCEHNRGYDSTEGVVKCVG